MHVNTLMKKELSMVQALCRIELQGGPLIKQTIDSHCVEGDSWCYRSRKTRSLVLKWHEYVV